MTYPVRQIMDHMKATGLEFGAAADDLEKTLGPAPVYPCTECGEMLSTEPDTMCGDCLFDPKFDN